MLINHHNQYNHLQKILNNAQIFSAWFSSLLFHLTKKVQLIAATAEISVVEGYNLL